ncbi:MupA/Atu3671 family FMN-dependent luciferase-like monooxygenase [Burkholderia sp. BCC0405]|uniref:MupA/Atu3671 family FMN-dependent luciferase-like monooxygenase n=1 Tax=Burkholderia sp. BCC0405 TaxID=2676298 RepID=UPI00158A5CFE|nr:MupA/Atu3671 family FMN-dependent luciferase-like monooxygenase [Burkholderia sp. BCC0405]
MANEPQTLIDLLRRASEQRGDRPLYRFLTTGQVDGPQETLSAQALYADARAVGNSIRDMLPADASRHVIVACWSPLDFARTFFGCLAAGAVPVPAYPPPLRAVAAGLNPIRSIIRDTSATLLIGDEASIDAILRVDPSFAAATCCRLFTTRELQQRGAGLDREPHPGRAEGTAFLQYTSGSTSEPRGCVITNRNIVTNLRMIGGALNPPPGAIGVTWLPLSHDLGLIGNFLLALYADIQELVVMTPVAFIERPVRWLQAISHFRAWGTAAPNFAFALCSRMIRKSQSDGLDLSSLQSVLCGAEPIQAATLDRFAFRFAPQGFRRDSIRPCYGLAEATLLVSLAPSRGLGVRGFDPDALAHGRLREVDGDAARRQIVSCGQVQPAIDVAIVSPHSGETLSDGEVGEVWIAGPSIANGYLGWDDARNAAVFKVPLQDKPYMRTGDLGAIVDGELYICGRVKDMIIVHGRNFDAHDLEHVAAGAHPDLRPDRIALLSDFDDGERVVLLAEVPRQAQPSDYGAIVRRIRARLGREYGLMLDRVVLAPPGVIAVTSSGKLRRARTREMWKAGELAILHEDGSAPEAEAVDEPSSDASDTAPATTELVLLREIRLAARLGEQEALPREARLSELGIDSLGLVQIVSTMSEWLHRDIGLTLVTDDPTLDTLLSRLGQLDAPDDGTPAMAIEPAAPATAKPERVALPRDLAHDVARAAGPDVAAPELSILFFASADQADDSDRYRFVRDAATLADRKGYCAVWVPERHFHPFGGLFPSPSVLSAALAGMTNRIRLRAGSVVMPLNDPIRVAEEWAMVDNLSGGRVDLAVATGWDAQSFVLAPDHFQSRGDVTFAQAHQLRQLWEGDGVTRKNGVGVDVRIQTYPRPLQRTLNLWVTATHRSDLFGRAGREGFNVLTALLHQEVATLANNIALYRQARAEAGLDPATGQVCVMLHTYVAEHPADALEAVSAPLATYLESAIDLWKRESEDLRRLPPEQVVEVALRRYVDRASLIGDPAAAARMLRKLKAVGVDEVACLVDFGVPSPLALDSIRRLSDTVAAMRGPKLAPSKAQVQDAAPPASGPDPLAELDPDLRHTLKEAAFDDVFEPAKRFDITDTLRRLNLMPFYLPFSHWEGSHARLGSRRILILSALDYLGLATHERVTAAAARAAREDGTGRSGSRVHSGTTPEMLAMEEKLAHFVGREDAVICTTGYQAMAGVVTTFMNNRTTLVVDESVHASIIDGSAIARCRLQRFRHNDHQELNGILAESRAVMVMIEGLYSNDGDIAALPEIAAVCKRHRVRLALDDAHGLGVLGATGRGTEEHYGALGAADLVAGTFSKSLASIGGWIAGDHDVIEYVRYHGRTVLFTAAIAPPTLAAASAALDVLIEQPHLVKVVARNAELVRFELRQRLVPVTGHHGPVIRIPIGDDRDCVRLSSALLDRGIFVHTVLYPSVPRGAAMIRLCISAAHDPKDLMWAAEEFADAYHAITGRTRVSDAVQDA